MPVDMPPDLGTPDFTLRPACAEDEPVFRAIYRSHRLQEFAPLPWPEQMKLNLLDSQFTIQAAGYRQQYPSAEFLAIEAGSPPKTVAGRLITSQTGDRLHILDILLGEHWRNRGLGTAILRGLQHEAGSAGLSITLQVAHGNPAGRLYARLGFAPCGEDELFQQLRWYPTTLASAQRP